MTPRLPPLLSALVLAAAQLSPGAGAQTAKTPEPAQVARSGPAWSSLTKAQQDALAPLQREWPSIDADRKAKWLEVAAKFPAMPVVERERIQARMADWSRLSPAERGRARLQFQESRQFAPEDRQARWEAYRSLPEDTRVELARRSKSPANGTPPPPKPANGDSKQAQAKRNVVPVSPAAATAATRPVTPTVVQVRPGATTTLMSRPVQPPVHQQPGLPKIAATEGFVDRNTLLPSRGPQGAAVRPFSAASAPTKTP